MVFTQNDLLLIIEKGKEIIENLENVNFHMDETDYELYLMGLNNDVDPCMLKEFLENEPFQVENKTGYFEIEKYDEIMNIVDDKEELFELIVYAKGKEYMENFKYVNDLPKLIEEMKACLKICEDDLENFDGQE